MSDPERLLTKGGDDDLARLLQVAEKDVLDDEDMGKLRGSLSATLGVATVGAGVNGAVKTASGWLGLGLKIAVPLVLAGAIGAGVHYYRHPAPAPPPALAPAAVTATPSPVITTPPEPLAPAAVAATASAPPSPARPAPPPRSAPSSSPRDGLLLLQARHSLETDPQHTLDLVRQHEREFPQSQLVPEREKLRAEATARGAK